MRSKTARGLALLALVTLTAPFAAGCKSQAQRAFDKAVDYYDNKDWKHAQEQFQKAVQLDPDNLEAHKALAQLDEFFGDQDAACQEYDAASRLAPTDEKLLSKARYCHELRQLANSIDEANGDIKAGKIDDGLGMLKDVLKESRSKSVRERAVAALAKDGGVIAQQGDDLVNQKKYGDAIKVYDSAVRAYMLVAEASGKTSLDPATDKILHSANQAAKAAGTPDLTFRLLNDVLTVDPDNKTANLELAQVYLARTPPDYETAADLMERGGAPDAEVKRLRAKAKHHG